MQSYKVFTIENGIVTAGAVTRPLENNTSVIMVGEGGRNRAQGVVPVDSPDKGLLFAGIEQTSTGKPKFIAQKAATTDEAIVVVLRTRIGFRGGNSHTGDLTGWECKGYMCNAFDSTAPMPIPQKCPKCGTSRDPEHGIRKRFAPFPGKILAKGRIAQGDAGRMGSGEQIVALIPRDVIFRTTSTGRMYGKPDTFYYQWDGANLVLSRLDREGKVHEAPEHHTLVWNGDYLDVMASK